MVAAAPTQDLPPTGGYMPISYKRIPARTYFRGWHWFAGFLATKVLGIYLFVQYRRRERYTKIENQSAFLAIQPLMFAEQDRGYLRQLIKNREEEADLMKKHPDWEVGKLWGEPIFKTISADEWVRPLSIEYFAHSAREHLENSAFFEMWH